MATPAKKLVHWDLNSPSLSDMGSPSLSLPNDSTDSFVSTSSLQYINSQLVAHGFTPSPGLSLDGISNEDLNRVTKCLLDLLAQRMKDMSRAEQLTTEIRTLTYDHERMKSMHQSASESAANFEREVNVQKSRVATVTKNLQQAENAHKQTMAELQRTRNALQTVRATHQAELRKKDKEFEKLADKWSKIADAQTKLGATASGLRFSGSSANAAVANGNQLGKGKGYLEVALDQAEKAREQLTLENTGLRMLVVRVANEVQRVTHEVKRYMPGTSQDAEEPPAFTLAALFPVSPADYTGDKLTSLLSSLRRALYDLEAYCRETIALSSSTGITTAKQPTATEEEIQRLKEVVEGLQAELKESQEHAASESTRAQELGVDIAAKDKEAERLSTLKLDFEHERRRFTESTIRFDREKAELEAEKHKLDEEKRKWQAELMLADVPPTADDSSSPSPPRKKQSPRSDEGLSKSKSKGTRSPRRAPGKSLKASIGRALASSRTGKRPSLTSSYSALTSPSKRPPKFEPAYETEVIPTPLLSSQLQPPSLLPNSFALPPPSPKAAFPPQPPTLLLSTPFDIPAPEEAADQFEDIKIEVPAPTSAIPETPQPTAPRRPFPMAKPLAPHMIHAYSPARPSPLSRILSLGNSPDSPDAGMAPVPEEEWADEDEDQKMEDMFPEINVKEPEMTLAQELGVSESPPESPVRPKEKEKEKKRSVAGATMKAKGRVVRDPPDIKSKVGSKSTMGVAQASKAPTRGTLMKSLPTSKTQASVKSAGSRVIGSEGKEKENSGTSGKGVEGGKPAAAATTAPRPRLKIPSGGAQAGAGRGGPRRVPIGSAEAPPVVQGRKS